MNLLTNLGVELILLLDLVPSRWASACGNLDLLILRIKLSIDNALVGMREFLEPTEQDVALIVLI